MLTSQRIKELSFVADSKKRGLIEPFDSTQLRSYYYNLSIELIIVPGQIPEKIILTNGQDYTLPPGRVIWVRMKELISLPCNIVASLEQTHYHTRRGISFLNLSRVYPNYSGFITCAIANFSSSPITISSSDYIARLVFSELEESTYVAHPVKDMSNKDDYDRALIGEARAIDNSFFGISNISQAIQSKIEADLEGYFKRSIRNFILVGSFVVIIFTILPALQEIFTKTWFGDRIVYRSDLPADSLEGFLDRLIDKRIEQRLLNDGEDD